MKQVGKNGERGERMSVERLEDARRLHAARMRGEEIGFLMALSPDVRADVPAFGTSMEMEAFMGGAYSGYRNEARSRAMTLHEFMERLVPKE